MAGWDARSVVEGGSFHVFVGGLVSGYLDELDDAEHGDPYQLEGGPYGEEEGEGISVDDAAYRGGYDIAFDIFRGRDRREI